MEDSVSDLIRKKLAEGMAVSAHGRNGYRAATTA